MCGRYLLTASPEEVRRLFRYAEQPNFPPRWNIAPTQPIAIVTAGPAGPRFMLVRWGLIPSWVEDPKSFSLLINARAETAAEKPSFRAAMRHRRCLVPASGFYEWRRTPLGKQPFFIRPRGGGAVGFAGLWETWSSADGSEIDTAAILTVPANRLVGQIHDRMPAVVLPEHHARWLDCMTVDVKEALTLIEPVPDDFFEAVPVGERVNKVANDDERLVEALTEPLGFEASAPIPRDGDATPPVQDAPRAPKSRRASAARGRGDQMDLF